ncbi:MAG: LuxR C-terminal-related transcriptional regulator [Lachnospiraceae bacterium]|nr:LuxR C-terminal-related transcriptional regulator [Lachnospiraceae bacterium]
MGKESACIENVCKEPDNPEKIFRLQDFAKAYGLTRRETEITQLILQGKTNAEIASELFISDTTVKKHVSNIFDKTAINRREELIIKIRDE